jgi:AraC-like DNA-binding protein
MISHLMGFSRYLPVNDEALRWEIFCNDAGYTQVPAGSSYPPMPEKHPKDYAATVATGRVLREFQVVYISSGRGWFEGADQVRRSITAGDLFIVFPGVRHAYSPDKETGWHEYWVGFGGEHANRLYRNGLFTHENPVHHIGLDQDIMADFEQIIQLCRQQPPGFQVLLGSLVLQLLAHVHACEIRSKTTHGDSDLVETARSIMLLHLEEGIEVEDIASELGMTYNHLLSIFRQYTGLTPYQYFLQLRIHRSKELLQDKDLSIKEISARMNFENQYYFSRLFKKKTGLSPSEWRSEAG